MSWKIAIQHRKPQLLAGSYVMASVLLLDKGGRSGPVVLISHAEKWDAKGDLKVEQENAEMMAEVALKHESARLIEALQEMQMR